MLEIAAKVGFGDFLLYWGAIGISFSKLYGHVIFSKVFDVSSSL